jgi:hypothetical protein
MAISLKSLHRVSERKPPRLIVYGVAGVGKSTFAAGAPSPVFIPIEDGLPIGVDAFPLMATFAEVKEALIALYTEWGDHKFKTVVIDSLDWLEDLVWRETCSRNKWGSIEDPGYGKGYAAALTVWDEYIEVIDALRDDKKMTIIQLAHAQVKRFDSPEHEPFDRYEIKLHKGAAALLMEHADGVLFANYRVSTIKSNVGFNKTVTRGTGRAERLLHTTEMPAFLAKNRFGRPDQEFPATLPLSWEAFENELNKQK